MRDCEGGEGIKRGYEGRGLLCLGFPLVLLLSFALGFVVVLLIVLC